MQRGWTAWLHAAIDDRVIAVAPTVLSCLNVQEVYVDIILTAMLHVVRTKVLSKLQHRFSGFQVMRHYFTSLGGWPLAFGPYYAENITSWMDHPHTDLLEEMVDPYGRWIITGQYPPMS